MEADRFIGGGASWGGYGHLAGLATSVLPFLEARGIATTKEVQMETLAERLRDDIVSHEGVVMWLTLVRLWAERNSFAAPVADRILPGQRKPKSHPPAPGGRKASAEGTFATTSR